MAQLKPGILGPGLVLNGVSVTLRPYLSGYRVFANHKPCQTLPFGGYVKDTEQGEETISRFKPQILSSAKPILASQFAG